MQITVVDGINVDVESFVVDIRQVVLFEDGLVE